MSILSIKKRQFLWLVSLILCAVGVVSFFSPIVYVLPHLKEFESVEETEIFFVSFFLKKDILVLHSFSILFSFLSFLTAVFSFLKEKDRRVTAVLIAIVSLIVIWLYNLGYEELFLIAF
ncbi:MAG: hypothetical protein LBH45_01795 [Campylobacteraceae bacterium]|jgi:hypothetical protein|nr:hypothetical protein [Campylobacteraceae bacterium]